MININRLMHDIEAMAEIGALPDGGIRRRALSAEDGEGRSYLIRRMEEAGLTVRVDAAGNIIGRREADRLIAGTESPDAGAAVVLGSHIDTIERAGRYDGIVGVFGAVECVRTLTDEGELVKRPIEVVAFTDEEERFLGFLGSYAVVGRISPENLTEVRDDDGLLLVDAMRAMNLNPDQIRAAERDRTDIAAFVELHIEQGPLLERDGASIGIVELVKGNYRWEVTVEGKTDHAGAPLHRRKDALMTMHGILHELIEFRERQGGAETTLTVGRVTVEPNIETTQPGMVRFSVDFRSPSSEFLRRASDTLRDLARRFARTEEIGVRCSPVLIEDPVRFDESVLATIRDAADDLGYRSRTMASGAGHDAQVMASRFPSAMIFVPSVDGRSHCPEEFTEQLDIERGVSVLYRTMVSLAGGVAAEVA